MQRHLNKIIKSFIYVNINFYILQFIIIMFFVLLNLNNNYENSPFIKNMTKNISHQLEIISLFQLNHIYKKQYDPSKSLRVYKLLDKYDYYYVLFYKTYVYCVFYSYKGCNFIYFPILDE